MPKGRGFYGVSGIYCILNTKNKKRYIGQSVNLGQRIKSHRLALKKGLHRCEHLQNAYNRYGREHFVFIVIEKCGVEDLDARESAWIDRYRSNHEDFGYNTRRHAVSNRGNTHSLSTRLRLSAAHSGRKKSPESVHKSAETRRGSERTATQKRRMASARKTTDEQAVRIILRLLDQEKWTMREIAAAAGVTRQYVARVKNKRPVWAEGLVPASDDELPAMPQKEYRNGTTLSIPKKRPSVETVREMLRLHAAEGWSGYKCAKHFGISRASADSILRGEVQWVRDAGLYAELEL